jgi:hypothetical protein
MINSQMNRRNTAQFLVPIRKEEVAAGKYDIYPSLKIAEDAVSSGYESLAKRIAKSQRVLVDGYVGVFFEDFKKRMDQALRSLGVEAIWVDVSKAMKTEDVVNQLVEPFLGGDDPIFGKRATLTLSDIFNTDLLNNLKPSDGLTIAYGVGASLLNWDAELVYLDLPKNELQFRSRARCITNLGCAKPDNPKAMYKRYYFVDWVVCNVRKQEIVGAVDVFVDVQRNEPVWIEGADARAALDAMSHNMFRVRPWFEPGAWGGQWIKNKIEGLNDDVPNYAWSFELIVPENGLLIQGGDLLLEISFDWLMYHDAKSVLGHCFEQYGVEFPIRFDFLDTYSGGNLSVQCHPQVEYIRKQFGENFTQEETYYILDAEPDASVYLGFQDDIEPAAFQNALQESFVKKEPMEVERYVQKLPSHKHDLFLIPPGTIHGSGINNLVLEISTTPYIFTFKMYDWLRLDLDGKPRPINIDRGMDNLCFDRKGDRVPKELVAHPTLINQSDDWKLYHLQTHPKHSYDVVRYHFNSEITIDTNNKCLVMSLVGGTSVEVESQSGLIQNFSYAETFVVPAAAGGVKVKNKNSSEAILVVAFMK